MSSIGTDECVRASAGRVPSRPADARQPEGGVDNG